MRESAAAKGARYLTEGRLTLLRVDQDRVAAKVRGDGAVYSITWTSSEGWRCTCPAYRTCAHVLALQAVRVRSA
jgi:uncharacterized Zn finger protein